MIKALRRWWRRRKYRRGVRRSFEEILSAFGRNGLTRIYQAYPGIRKEIDSAFPGDESEDQVGVRIATVVIADLLEKNIDSKSRQEVLEELQRAADADPGLEPSPPRFFVVTVILEAEETVYRWVRSGRVEEEDREFMMSEVIGALSGQTYDDRQHQRIVAALEKGVFSSRDRGEERP